jgi:ankyrin repeat protein
VTLDEAHHAIKKGDLVALRHALDAGLDSNSAAMGGWTLLMHAAYGGQTLIGELLYSKGAEINATGHHGESALYLAANKGHVKFVQWLLTVGADTDCRPYGHPFVVVLRGGSGLPPDLLSRMIALVASENSNESEVERNRAN